MYPRSLVVAVMLTLAVLASTAANAFADSSLSFDAPTATEHGVITSTAHVTTDGSTRMFVALWKGSCPSGMSEAQEGAVDHKSSTVTASGDIPIELHTSNSGTWDLCGYLYSTGVVSGDPPLSATSAPVDVTVTHPPCPDGTFTIDGATPQGDSAVAITVTLPGLGSGRSFFADGTETGETLGTFEATGAGPVTFVDQVPAAVKAKVAAGKSANLQIYVQFTPGDGQWFPCADGDTWVTSPRPTSKVITVALGAAPSIPAAGLSPTGAAARIGAILGAGGFPATIAAPGAGTARIAWYSVASGARAVMAKPVLMAVGSKTVARAGKIKVRIALTKAGRARLKKVKPGHRLALVAKASFRAKGSLKTATTTKAFSLKR